MDAKGAKVPKTRIPFTIAQPIPRGVRPATNIVPASSDVGILLALAMRRRYDFRKESVRMLARLRSVLLSGKICMALLLGVVAVAMVIPGSNVAFSQPGPGTVPQVPLFTAIDLHPSGFYSSEALGISGGQQVGYGIPLTSRDRAHHALLWRGSADSVVDLHPSGFVSSEAHGISGGEQVGFGGLGPLEHGGDYDIGPFHALLWRGGAGSVVDLHPSGFSSSQAFGTNGHEQVGRGLTVGGDFPAGVFHALLWRGGAGSVVDLHPSGYASSSQAFGISDDQQVGSGWIAVPGHETHALMWHGSATSMVDINPIGFASSEAVGISGRQQVGYGQRDGNCIGPPPTYALLWLGSARSAVDLKSFRAAATSGGEQVGDDGSHAILWSDNGKSVVDLHAFLPSGFGRSFATGIDVNGDVVGYAEFPSRDSYPPAHAFLWKRNVNVMPVPPTDTGVASQDLTVPKRLIITSDSSDNQMSYILTDPQGRRTGYDPVHDVSYREIPEAMYRIDSCERDQWTVLEVANRLAGRYTLDVFGSGAFKVSVLGWGVSGHWLTYAFEGTVAPGGSSRFTFPGDVTTFAAFKATVKINSGSGAFEVNGTYTLGPGGTISPTTQDVTIAVAGVLSATIPAGSFRQIGQAFVFKGVTNDVAIEATLVPTGVNSGTFKIEGASAARIEGTKDAEFGIGTAEAIKPDYPISVGLAIGNYSGSVSVHAEFSR